MKLAQFTEILTITIAGTKTAAIKVTFNYLKCLQMFFKQFKTINDFKGSR